jgi:hypothetical protein
MKKFVSLTIQQVGCCGSWRVDLYADNKDGAVSLMEISSSCGEEKHIFKGNFLQGWGDCHEFAVKAYSRQKY